TGPWRTADHLFRSAGIVFPPPHTRRSAEVRLRAQMASARSARKRRESAPSLVAARSDPGDDALHHRQKGRKQMRAGPYKLRGKFSWILRVMASLASPDGMGQFGDPDAY